MSDQELIEELRLFNHNKAADRLEELTRIYDGAISAALKSLPRFQGYNNLVESPAWPVYETLGFWHEYRE